MLPGYLYIKLTMGIRKNIKLHDTKGSNLMTANPEHNSHTILDVRSLREQIYEYLKNGIQTGQLVPGAFIKLNEISERLGVSKTPLRDALIKLELKIKTILQNGFLI